MLYIILILIQVYSLNANINDPKKGGGQTCNCYEEFLNEYGQYVEVYHCKIEISTWARDCYAYCKIPYEGEIVWNCGTSTVPNVHSCVEHPNETYNLGCYLIQDYSILLESYFPSCGFVCYMGNYRNEGGSKNYDIVIPVNAGIPCLCGL